MNYKIAKIWIFYFFFSFTVLQIHFIRYLNSFLTGYVRFSATHIDYGFVTTKGLIIRFICFIISLFILKYRRLIPITSTTLTWLLSFILLSNEYDKSDDLAIGVLSLFIVSLFCSIYVNFNSSRLLK